MRTQCRKCGIVYAFYGGEVLISPQEIDNVPCPRCGSQEKRIMDVKEKEEKRESLFTDLTKQ